MKEKISVFTMTTSVFELLGIEDPMKSGTHVIRCARTGEALANKLDGGTCLCKSTCEMREMRERKGDYANYNTDPRRTEDFDAVGFAIGIATGFPVSPRGITAGSIIGSLLHPTERHAPYDVTRGYRYPGNDATPDVQPAAPPPPLRSPDWSDNALDEHVSAPRSDPAPVIDTPQSYTTPAPVPDSTPSYSEPAPSYSAPDPSPSYTDSTPSYSAPDPSPSYSGGSND